MKFKEFLKDFFVGIKSGISRFLTAFICTILFYLTSAYTILFESDNDKIIIPLCMSFALTAVLSVLLKTVQEYLTDKLKNGIQYAVCAISAVATFILTKVYYESLYMIMSYTGIMIALVCFIFFVLMRGDNRDLVFPRLVSSSVFASAICGVLSGGLSTCLAAFQSLIFSFDDFYKVYEIVLLFIWIVCYINVFLSFIPKKDVPVPQSKIFRIFALFAGLPIYILLIAILLVYLAKIVITWNMPVGEINWFASFASLFFIFFLLSVRQYSEKIAKLFSKYGGYFLLPVLVMQAIAVFERINAYGLTTPRTVSLVLIVISVLFIIGSIIAPKHLNKIALVSGIIVLLVTITPLNVIDMPVKSQTKILENVLVKNDMIKNGKVVPNENVSEEDTKIISSAYYYLKNNADKVPDFIEDPDKTFKEIFGVEGYNRYTNSNITYANYETKDTVDISGYKTMIDTSYYYEDVFEVEHDGKKYNIDLKQISKQLYDQYGEGNKELDLYIVDENISLYFSNLQITVDNGEITYIYFDGYALLK